MIASGYSMDLYCESDPCASERWKGDQNSCSIAGHNRTDCLKQARAKGWKVIYKRNYALCPQCVKVERHAAHALAITKVNPQEFPGIVK